MKTEDLFIAIWSTDEGISVQVGQRDALIAACLEERAEYTEIRDEQINELPFGGLWERTFESEFGPISFTIRPLDENWSEIL